MRRDSGLLPTGILRSATSRTCAHFETWHHTPQSAEPSLDGASAGSSTISKAFTTQHSSKMIMKPMDLSDINGPAIKNASWTLDVKDRLMVVLKEYDALRKQVDQGTAFMQGLVIPLSVGLSGAMIGWQGKIPPELALLALPVLVMCGLAAAQHGEAYTEYTGQLLAAVEDRVFQISGIPL